MIFLDTMALLFFVNGDERLPLAAREEILTSHTVSVSVASIWEAGIKGKLGKLYFLGEALNSPQALERLVARCREEEIEVVPIQPQHACAAPFLAGGHKDPFDRMIVAQALERHATLLSSDAALDALSPALRRKWAEPTRKPPSRV
jgi:PIN domain nuclease of toxin-antitoxin system